MVDIEKFFCLCDTKSIFIFSEQYNGFFKTEFSKNIFYCKMIVNLANIGDVDHLRNIEAINDNYLVIYNR